MTIELASYLLDWPAPAQIKKILQFLSANQGRLLTNLQDSNMQSLLVLYVYGPH